MFDFAKISIWADLLSAHPFLSSSIKSSTPPEHPYFIPLLHRKSILVV